VIIEIGSNYLRAGFASESEPRVELQIPLYADDENDEKDILHSPLLLVKSCYSLSPFEWEEKLNPLIDQVYKRLLIRATNFRVMLILSPFFSSSERQHPQQQTTCPPSSSCSPLCQALNRIFLEYLQVPALAYVDADRAAAFAFGRIRSSSSSPLITSRSDARSCSLVTIDIGHYESRCICIYNGAALYETLHIVPCGYHTFVQHVLQRWEQELKESSSSSYTATLTSKSEWDEKYVQSFVHTFHQTSSPDKNTHTTPIIHLLHHFSSMNQRISSTRRDDDDAPDKVDSILLLEKIVHECIYEFYFSWDNPYSLLRGFLDTIVACPIDLKHSMIRNVVFIGEGLMKIPNIESHFYHTVIQLYTLFSTTNHKEMIHRHIPIAVLDILWNTYSTLRPILLSTNDGTSNEETTEQVFQGLSILYPLPYLPKHVIWIGGGIIGSIVHSLAEPSSSSLTTSCKFVDWITQCGKVVRSSNDNASMTKNHGQ